jgi:hypothetical protein
MLRVVHLLLLSEGGEDEPVPFVGTSLISAGTRLLDHLTSQHPEADWSSERYTAARIDEVIDEFRRGVAPVSGTIQHVSFDLEQALAHEHGGEAPAISVVPLDEWRQIVGSIVQGPNGVGQRPQTDQSGGD